MVPSGALTEEALEQISAAGQADILVGIPSYNNAETISRVIKAAELGLAKYFPQHKSAILVSEGGDVEATSYAVSFYYYRPATAYFGAFCSPESAAPFCQPATHATPARTPIMAFTTGSSTSVNAPRLEVMTLHLVYRNEGDE